MDTESLFGDKLQPPFCSLLFTVIALAAGGACASVSYGQDEPYFVGWEYEELYSSEFRFTSIVDAVITPHYVFGGFSTEYETISYSLLLVATPGINKDIGNWQTTLCLAGGTWFNYEFLNSPLGLPDTIRLSEYYDESPPSGYIDGVTTYRLQASVTYADDTASVEWAVGESVEITNAVSHVRGDYNFDGMVDAADYTVWRDNLGGSGPIGDGVGEGTVGWEDHEVFRGNYGMVRTAAGASATPEPTSAMLIGIALARLSAETRKRSVNE